MKKYIYMERNSENLPENKCTSTVKWCLFYAKEKYFIILLAIYFSAFNVTINVYTINV